MSSTLGILILERQQTRPSKAKRSPKPNFYGPSLNSFLLVKNSLTYDYFRALILNPFYATTNALHQSIKSTTMSDKIILHLTAAGCAIGAIALMYVVVLIFEDRPKRRARREASYAYEEILRRINFCSHISYIYDLQDEVMDYTNTWKAIIDLETLDYFTGALYKAISEKEAKLQAERNQRYSKSLYN